MSAQTTCPRCPDVISFLSSSVATLLHLANRCCRCSPWSSSPLLVGSRCRSVGIYIWRSFGGLLVLLFLFMFLYIMATKHLISNGRANYASILLFFLLLVVELLHVCDCKALELFFVGEDGCASVCFRKGMTEHYMHECMNYVCPISFPSYHHLLEWLI
jgi:hypothetical protein